MMLMTGFILLFWLRYFCAITDSWLLLMLCSLITGFIRMALTLVNLFALILYAFKIEASDIITPGAEATDPVVADKNDQAKGLTQPIIRRCSFHHEISEASEKTQLQSPSIRRCNCRIIDDDGWVIHTDLW